VPIIADPSHGTGHANLVESMAAASVATCTCPSPSSTRCSIRSRS
jgi:3-deoxy-D-arabino-heptulosonate 7-phosphate (DAHP) synthase